MSNIYNTPLVTIITVCFNSEQTIKKTLDSILKQTYNPIEYLIIDGKSTDGTIEFAKKYIKPFEEKGIKYSIISEKDHGLYDAMNKGICMSNGEIIGIVNSDDWYEADAVETAVKIYKKKTYDILMCSMNRWKGTKKSVKKPKIRKYKTSADFCHPAMFVTKKTYEEIGCYDIAISRVYADFDFWLRQFRENRKLVISGKIITNFTLGGASNQKSLKEVIVRIKDRYHIYRHNGYSRLYIAESFFAEIAKMILA